nr:MAG TPA: hypothetical protein [Caudoviricetes sp.]
MILYEGIKLFRPRKRNHIKSCSPGLSHLLLYHF